MRKELDLDLDSWCLVFSWLSVKDAIRFVMLNKSFVSAYFDVSYAHVYASNILKDKDFWMYARKRPTQTSKPLETYRAEIKRIEFCRETGVVDKAKDLYAFWKLVDKV